jgi:hypothetical protein
LSNIKNIFIRSSVTGTQLAIKRLILIGNII